MNVLLISVVAGLLLLGALLTVVARRVRGSRVSVAVAQLHDVDGPPRPLNPQVVSHVATGRDTPYSLAVRGGMPSMRDVIVQLNRGRAGPNGVPWHGGVFPVGMAVLLPAELASTTPSPLDNPASPAPIAAGIASALLLSAGALAVLDSRRASRLRSSGPGSQSASPADPYVRTETLLRGLGATERVARVDAAIRSAALSLAEQGAAVAAVLLGDSGDVRLFLRGAARAEAGPWHSDGIASVWDLDGAVPLAELAEQGCAARCPCPALVHVGGVDEGGECFVDLEVIGLLSVDSPFAEPILRHLAASLEVSPLVSATRVITSGFDEPSILGLGERTDSLGAALTGAALAVGSTGELACRTGTFALRVAGVSGDTWDPAVVIAADRLSDAQRRELTAIAVPGSGLAAVIQGHDPSVAWSLSWHGDAHVLEPLALRVRPCGLGPDDLASLRELLAAEAEPLAIVGVQRELTVTSGHASITFDELPWSLLVRTYGRVEVVDAAGTPARFERSKALELVVWLSSHRQRATRSRVRAALWDIDVRDATFANIVSDARCALARAVAPVDSQEWIARTLTEELPLHARVVSDAALLEHRIRQSRGLATLDAIDVLRPGLELVEGMPFAGTGYVWADAEGISSRHVLLAIGAAVQLGELYLSMGDIDGVFWATGQGLKVLGGHEELIALRMRAYARGGDLSGVRSEWERYERAIAADPWEASEPSPKLLLLRRELLGHRSRAG